MHLSFVVTTATSQESAANIAVQIEGFVLAGSLGNAEDKNGFIANLEKTALDRDIMVNFVVGMKSTQEVTLNLINIRDTGDLVPGIDVTNTEHYPSAVCVGKSGDRFVSRFRHLPLSFLELDVGPFVAFDAYQEFLAIHGFGSGDSRKVLQRLSYMHFGLMGQGQNIAYSHCH